MEKFTAKQAYNLTIEYAVLPVIENIFNQIRRACLMGNFSTPWIPLSNATLPYCEREKIVDMLEELNFEVKTDSNDIKSILIKWEDVEE